MLYRKNFGVTLDWNGCMIKFNESKEESLSWRVFGDLTFLPSAL